MSDKYNENVTNMYNPNWYNDVFDKYISIADISAIRDNIINSGYNIPDSDGAKSTTLRNTAITNSTFSESDVHNTINDIYNNSYTKLIASNHDNTHFFKFSTTINDINIEENTNYCSFDIPWDSFIASGERLHFTNKYRNTWITNKTINSDWNTFKWSILLFINGKVYNDYEIFISNQKATIRLEYFDAWLTNNYSISLYKFDTNYQSTALISSNLCYNVWDWKLPLSYIEDDLLHNHDYVICHINKTRDQSIRTDGQIDGITVLGENIEFFKIINGCIDMTSISDINKSYITSESSQFLNITFIVPKFIHEYPILLPVDNVYRGFKDDNANVYVDNNETPTEVYADDSGLKFVYADPFDIGSDKGDWITLVRPIVLSDAYNNPEYEPYLDINENFMNLIHQVTLTSDNFENFMKLVSSGDFNDESFHESYEIMASSIVDLYNLYSSTISEMHIEIDNTYITLYDGIYKTAVNDILVNKEFSEYLNYPTTNDLSFWNIVSPLIYIPRNFANLYIVGDTVVSLYNDRMLLSSSTDYKKVRFNRPIEVNDFWIFEYDYTNKTWYPIDVNIIYKYPDIYLIDIDLNDTSRVFKAFMFYSDTIDVNNQTRDIIETTHTWDGDNDQYERIGGQLIDLHVEKMYWMMAETFSQWSYSGCRWELIEFIIDNEMYIRLNDVFIETGSSTIKLSLANYIKDDDYLFTHDYEKNKLLEQLQKDITLNTNKVKAFETYLSHNHTKPYIDYVEYLGDDWNVGDRLVMRADSSFEVQRLLHILDGMGDSIINVYDKYIELILLILDYLSNENYSINVGIVNDLLNNMNELNVHIDSLQKLIIGLDIELYSISELSQMYDLMKMFMETVNRIEEYIKDWSDDIELNTCYPDKLSMLADVEYMIDQLSIPVSYLLSHIDIADVRSLLTIIDDLKRYINYYEYHDADSKLIGTINEFNDPWSIKIKECRNAMYINISNISSMIFERSYSFDEMTTLMNEINELKDNIIEFKGLIESFWSFHSFDYDEVLINMIDIASSHIIDVCDGLYAYYERLFHLNEMINEIIDSLNDMDVYNVTYDENSLRDIIIDSLNDMYLKCSSITSFDSSADGHIDHILGVIDEWDKLLQVEEYVFELMGSATIFPNEYTIAINDVYLIFELFMNYLDIIVNADRTDIKPKTYNWLYTTKSVDIINHGIYNEIADILYVPDIGVLRITDINKDNGNCITSIELCSNIYNISLSDPSSVDTTYDSISSGIGVGNVFKPSDVEKVPIINDHVLDDLFSRMINVLHSLNSCVNNMNSANMTTTSLIINELSDLRTEINNIDQTFISDKLKSMMDEIIPEIGLSNQLLIRFNSNRSQLFTDTYMTDITIAMSYISSYNNDMYDYGDIFSDTIILYRMFQKWLSDNEWTSYSEYTIAIEDLMNSFENIQSSSFDNNHFELNIIMDNAIKSIESTNELFVSLELLRDMCLTKSDNITNLLENAMNLFYQDELYVITGISISYPGNGYNSGDIVRLVGIVDDVIYAKVTTVNTSNEVTGVSMMINYATTYSIRGIQYTSCATGKGNGLVVSISSELVHDIVNESNLYNENDLLKYTFNNIHDINVRYDIFIAGTQITDFIVRHIKLDDKFKASYVDEVYVNANKVISAHKSTSSIKGGTEYVYKIDPIEIINPGKGYSIGQTIYTNASTGVNKMIVSGLKNTPLKEISSVSLDGIEVDLSDNVTTTCDAILDSMNNIDDEFNIGFYDNIGSDGIVRKLSHTYDTEYIFKRHDTLDSDDRNAKFMYPDIKVDLTNQEMLNNCGFSLSAYPPKLGYTGGGSDVTVGIDVSSAISSGDIDGNWYLGGRIDNSQHPMTDARRWNGIWNVIPPTNSFFPDKLRVPSGQPIKGEYQQYCRVVMINSTPKYSGMLNATPMIFDHNAGESKCVATLTLESMGDYPIATADLYVASYELLPKNINDWSDGCVGKTVIVISDNTNQYHRTLYKIISFSYKGNFVYDTKLTVDASYTSISVDWLNAEWKPDIPSINAQYTDAPWEDGRTFNDIEKECHLGMYDRYYTPTSYESITYIHDLTDNDISIFNHTLKVWEDLKDTKRWNLSVYNGENDTWGFTITLLESGQFKYDMELFFNKTPDTLSRNVALKENATFSINSTIAGVINTDDKDVVIDPSRYIMFRKVFSYNQTEERYAGYDEYGELSYNMDIDINDYNQFRNTILMKDISVYNKTLKRFENIFDDSLFEIQMKDPNSIDNDYETNTKIVNTRIISGGNDFVDGYAWGYNDVYDVHIFGRIGATDGSLSSLSVLHMINADNINTSITIDIYQHGFQVSSNAAQVIMEFSTASGIVYNDGYIHNILNPDCKIVSTVRLVPQYNLSIGFNYEITINKDNSVYEFINNDVISLPIYTIPNRRISSDNIYILTSSGRYPLVNPSTGVNTFVVTYNSTDTIIQLMTVVPSYEKVSIYITPYNMRSVYTLRNIPSDGYIDVYGKLNKPLSKKYYEFWANGKLLRNEVSIISPTKLFLHGLTSLLNFEIIEVGRNYIEYFSDSFLKIGVNDVGNRPCPIWEFDTYLDEILDGEIEDYTYFEQSSLLGPIYPQIDIGDELYTKFPENSDHEDDILSMLEASDFEDLLVDVDLSYALTNAPTLENVPMMCNGYTFPSFGFIPITDDEIVEILNEVWANEIENDPYFNEHVALDSGMWYGIAAKLYDSSGNETTNINNALYYITDNSILEINTDINTSNIIRNTTEYDLT